MSTMLYVMPRQRPVCRSLFLRRPLISSSCLRAGSAGEEADGELLMAFLRLPHQIPEFGHSPQTIQQRISFEVGIRKKPSFNGLAKDADCRWFVTQHGVSLGNLLEDFCVAHTAF